MSNSISFSRLVFLVETERLFVVRNESKSVFRYGDSSLLCRKFTAYPKVLGKVCYI